MNIILNEVVNKFSISQEIISVNKHGEGHIHETFLVETQDHKPDYILQKINHNIFRDIPGMMSNIENVTRHLKRKLNDLAGHNSDLESLTLIYAKSGHSFYQDEDENYWRMYVFIPDTVTYQKMSDSALGFEAGKAIGLFQAMLTDLNALLVETIPDFHNIEWRIQQYKQAKQNNPSGRVSAVEDDLLFAEARFDRMNAYFRSLKEKAVVRATHNDTKLNNILFNSENKAQCLIDLDTVMPGYVHFDYGDALRTMANTALEDERDLSKVMFNMGIYNSFTRGYLEEAARFLTPDERALLPYAPIYLTFIIGLRFLTDFINGDIYYRTNYLDHNLERARVQFKLVEEMERSLNFEFL